MDDTVPDAVRGLLSKYILERENRQANDDLMCTLCKKLMTDAYQTFCGCQYCRGCIYDYLSNEEHKYCPGTNEECDEEYLVVDNNVLRNAMLNRRILRVKVTCPNATCHFSTELRHMDDHLQTCMQRHVVSPYSTLGGNSERGADDSLATHLGNETVPHTHLSIELINNLKNEIDAVRLELIAVQKHCFCKKNAMRYDYKGETDKIRTVSQINQNKIEILEQDIKKNEKKLAYLEGKLIDKDVTINNFQNRIRRLEENSGINEGRMSKVEMRSIKNESVSQEISVQVDKLNDQIKRLDIGTNTKVAVGMMVFTLDNFSVLSKHDEGIVSPYFYSHTNGYKLKMLVYPKGTDTGLGTHISVYIGICKGEYDDIIPWPCTSTIEICIMNQYNGEKHNEVLLTCDQASERANNHFSRPTDGDNTASGYAKFISHQDLIANVGLSANDSVVIKCVVTAPS